MIIDNVTLEELLLELDYLGVRTDFTCHFCKGATQLEVSELHPLGYKIRCARCRGSIWGGKRGDVHWNVKGFDGTKEIYSEEVELNLGSIQSHIQGLARQHLIRGDKNRPELWQVRRDRSAPRLSFMCGVDPHYVAIAIDRKE